MIVTTKGFSRVCPECGKQITIVGKYGMRPGQNWVLLRSECPLFQNERLPPLERNISLPQVQCQGPRVCGIEALPPELTDDEL